MDESGPIKIEKAILLRAIKGLKRRSPGEDGIVLDELLMMDQSSMVNYLQKLPECIFMAKSVPTALRSSIILPIPKSGENPTASQTGVEFIFYRFTAKYLKKQYYT